jgi:hypothetical protein
VRVAAAAEPALYSCRSAVTDSLTRHRIAGTRHATSANTSSSAATDRYDQRIGTTADRQCAEHQQQLLGHQCPTTRPITASHAPDATPAGPGLRGFGAKGEAYGEFANTRRHGVRHHAEQTDAREQQRERGKQP